jgi:hypothetical protein
VHSSEKEASMNKAHRLALILALGLAAALSPTPQSGWAHPAAPQAPILGPHIDIWLDDVDNYATGVAYNNLHDEYLVVWNNDRGATSDIYARRVRSDGTLLSNFTIAHSPGYRYYEADVAYSPTHDEYLVVYTFDSPTTGSDIWARRVAWDGSWIKPEFAIRQEADNQHSPAIAYNSQFDEYLVVYQNTWIGDLQDIAAQRVRASDGALESWCNIATAPPSSPDEKRIYPDVAYNAARNEYLIVYAYQATSTYDPGDVYGKISSADMGGLSDEIHICDTSVSQLWRPHVAAGPDEYLVVWANRFANPILDDVYARRVSWSGIPQDPVDGFPVAEGMGYQMNPTVAYGAAYGYLITWHDAPTNWHTYGRYVLPGHDAAVGVGVELSDTESFDTLVEMACAPTGTCLVVTSAFLSTNYDIVGRIVSPHRVYLPLVVHN